MGKKVKKKNKGNSGIGISDNQLLKNYTANTADVVVSCLKNVSLDDLISGIYLNCSPNDSKYSFMKIYEKQLVLAKLKEVEFRAGLHMFFMNTYKYIKVNKKYNDFFDFSNFVYLQLEGHRKNILDDNGSVIKRMVVDAYQNLLLQQFAYFEGINKTVYSISDDGLRTYTLGEIGKGLNAVNSYYYKCLQSHCSIDVDKMLKIVQKENREIKTPIDLEALRIFDQLVVNNIFQMSYYMKDSTRFLMPMKFKHPMHIIDYPSCFKDSGLLDLLIKKTRYRDNLLPSKGVVCSFKDNNFVRSVSLCEIEDNNNIILVYNVKYINDEEAYGFYNPNEELFYSMWKHSSADSIFNVPLGVLVVGVYFYLTSYCLECDDVILRDIYTYLENMIDYCSMEFDNSKEISNNSMGKRVRIGRKEYHSMYKKVAPYIRNLPTGSKASAQAIEEARKRGIRLAEGKTFVREFNRTFKKK